MSFLDRFRRNKQDSVLPDEVKEYYQSERRQKRGVAIGLALVALVVTVGIAAILFFGGRFAYNQIWGDDDKKETETVQNEGQESSGNEEQQGQPQGEPGEQATPPPPSQPRPAPAPQPTPQPAPSTPSLGDEPLPHTGDPGM